MAPDDRRHLHSVGPRPDLGVGIHVDMTSFDLPEPTEHPMTPEWVRRAFRSTTPKLATAVGYDRETQTVAVVYEQGEIAFRLAQGTALVLHVVLPAKGGGYASLVAEAPDGTRTPIASCGRHQAEYVEWLDELARAISIAADLAPLRVEVDYDA